MLTLWNEAGIVNQSGMGVSSITWTEIRSWVKETKSTISVWEKLTIKAMSEAYASEYSAASDKDRPAPYCSLPLDFDRGEMGGQVVSVMQSLMAKQQQSPKKRTKE